MQKTTSETVGKFKEAVKNPGITVEDFSNSEALALYMDLDLSCRQYKIMRSSLEKKGFRGLPSYEKISEEKSACVPEGTTVDEVSAKVPLQSMLDHTTTRIIESQTIKNGNMSNFQKLVLYTKWGCDGSSGQSQYKQRIGKFIANM